MIKNQWYAITSSKKIPENKLVGLKRLGLKLCLFRDTQGDIACIADKCTHRGASLSKGKFKNGKVACPFHGLEFDKNGECTLIPANGKISDIEKRFDVEKFLVKEAHDIIYFWYGDQSLATDILPFFDEFIDDTFIYGEMTDVWNAHYSRCIENQLDVVHVPFVHFDTIGRGQKTLVNGPGLEVSDYTITISPNNVKDECQLPKKESECEKNTKTNLCFRFPNIWTNQINDKMKIFIFFAPVDNKKTVFYIRFYTKQFDSLYLNKTIAFFGKFLNKHIETQDKVIVEKQIPKISSLKCGENLLKGDSPIVKYRILRDELQKKGSVR